MAEPLALQIRKRGRLCVVAKITSLDGQPILGVVHRAQHGTTDCISLPPSALDYAEAVGCRWLYFRNDRTMTMRRMRLSDVRRGWLQADGEVYVRIDQMEACPWRRWPYAERTILLDAPPPAADLEQPSSGPVQLTLLEAVTL